MNYILYHLCHCIHSTKKKKKEKSRKPWIRWKHALFISVSPRCRYDCDSPGIQVPHLSHPHFHRQHWWRFHISADTRHPAISLCLSMWFFLSHLFKYWNLYYSLRDASLLFLLCVMVRKLHSFLFLTANTNLLKGNKFAEVANGQHAQKCKRTG